MPIRPSPRKTPASLLSGPHTSSSPWEQVPLLTKQPQHSDKHLGRGVLTKPDLIRGTKDSLGPLGKCLVYSAPDSMYIAPGALECWSLRGGKFGFLSIRR